MENYVKKKQKYRSVETLCKPTFIRIREILLRLVSVSSSRIFFPANKSFSYGCYSNTGLDKTWSRTTTDVVVANQFIVSESLNKLAANKS